MLHAFHLPMTANARAGQRVSASPAEISNLMGAVMLAKIGRNIAIF
jgi:hypothetical protein